MDAVKVSGIDLKTISGRDVIVVEDIIDTGVYVRLDLRPSSAVLCWMRVLCGHRAFIYMNVLCVLWMGTHTHARARTLGSVI